MEYYALKICEIFDLNPHEIILPKWSKRPASSRLKIITTLLEYDNSKEAIESLSASVMTLYRVKHKLLPCSIDKDPKGSWRLYLLRLLGLKLCSKCKNIKSVDSFYKRTSECIKCNKYLSLEHRKLNREELCQKSLKWQRENKALVRAKNARRRAALLNAIVAWTNIEDIKEFYIQCPEGCQVDHIIPLQNNIIQGLHTLDNLQYLPSTVNNAKNNHFNQEEYYDYLNKKDFSGGRIFVPTNVSAEYKDLLWSRLGEV